MIHYIDPKTGSLLLKILLTILATNSRHYADTDEFLKWSETERKDAIVKELENKGIPLEELKKKLV